MLSNVLGLSALAWRGVRTGRGNARGESEVRTLPRPPGTPSAGGGGLRGRHRDNGVRRHGAARGGAHLKTVSVFADGGSDEWSTMAPSKYSS